MRPETTYRVCKRLETGEWHPWTTSLRTLEEAKEHLEVLQEDQPGEYRIARYDTTPEWVDA